MTASVDSAWRRGDTSRTIVRSGTPRVAFQGERGAYGDTAIETIWGTNALPLAAWSFDDVIATVLAGKCDYGVLPVENTVVGPITVVCDALAAVGASEALTGEALAIVHEVTVPVRHALLGQIGATLSSITSVTSHPVALAQCGHFLRRHPQMVPHDSYDTAGAARDVAARGHQHEAAIAGIPAARRYHLTVLAEDIQDISDNQTRFVVVERLGRKRW